jgi:aminomethyltransferase
LLIAAAFIVSQHHRTLHRMSSPLQRTPLFAAHQRRGARLIDFGGWEMPVQYSSIVDEHLCVRRAAGIFDISHMGQVSVAGGGAAAFLNHLLTNDLRKLTVGLGQYTLLCNDRGGVVDDLYAYRTADAEFLLVINASRIDADLAWITQQLAAWPDRANVRLQNLSGAWAAVALQGPRVKEICNTLFPGASTAGIAAASLSELAKNQLGQFSWDGQKIWIARTGYTGEDGFEIMSPAALIESIWEKSLALGHTICLQPAGLGARDTLRTEMGYPLYGHELDENTTPIEAGLGFFVALDKGDFIGRAALAAQKSGGTAKKLVAFKMADKSAPPRPHYPIWTSGEKNGEVVSGTQSPSLNIGIGMGYVPPAAAKPGTRIEIEIRARRFPADVVVKPIYRKPA